MWIKFAGKIIDVGECADIEIKPHIKWDMIYIEHDSSYLENWVEINIFFKNPVIYLEKILKNPLIDKVKTKEICNEKDNTKEKINEYEYKTYTEIVNLEVPMEKIRIHDYEMIKITKRYKLFNDSAIYSTFDIKENDIHSFLNKISDKRNHEFRSIRFNSDFDYGYNILSTKDCDLDLKSVLYNYVQENIDNVFNDLISKLNGGK